MEGRLSPTASLSNGEDVSRCFSRPIHPTFIPGKVKEEPSIAEKAPDEDRAQLIREPLAIEREIAEELKK